MAKHEQSKSGEFGKGLAWAVGILAALAIGAEILDS